MINYFHGEYRFLSNFWFAEVEFEGIIYSSVEHAFQAAKTLNPEIRRVIRFLSLPSYAKRYTKGILVRPDWNKVRLGIMEQLVRQKFTKHFDLKKKLLDTGEQELIEGNIWNDTFWGICKGKGENNLGKILMKIRAELNALMV